VQITEAN